jgi:hypothetical protein
VHRYGYTVYYDASHYNEKNLIKWWGYVAIWTIFLSGGNASAQFMVLNTNHFVVAKTFQDALKRVLQHEGGYVNHPSDPGGETNYNLIKWWGYVAIWTIFLSGGNASAQFMVLNTNHTRYWIKTFQDALKRVLQHEGGYVNHPSDPGGETNYGITKSVARQHD